MKKLIDRIPTECGNELSKQNVSPVRNDPDSIELIARGDKLLQVLNKRIEDLEQLKFEAEQKFSELFRSGVKLFLRELSKDEFKSYLNSLAKEEREQFLKN